MSRRRGPRDDPWIPGSKRISVVCTDAGQHPEVSFGHVVVWPEDGGWRMHGNPHLKREEYVDLAALETYPLPQRVPKTYPLKCRRCGRNVPLKRETLERVCVGLAAADTPKFDISDI